MLSLCRDSAAMMMDDSPPLLARRPPPCRGLSLQQDDGTVGAKNAVAYAATMEKFGIVAHAIVSRGAVTNTMEIVAWRQRP